MAPATVSLPLVLRASFLFSGMFGIRLEGINDQNGQPIIVQSAMPLNFTVPAVIMNQTSQQFALLPTRTDNSRCLDKCKTSNANNAIIPSADLEFISSVNNNNELDTAPPILSVQKQKQTTGKPLVVGKPCGPGRCSHGEICVSWMRQRQTNNQQKSLLISRRESPMMVHECLPNDGIHWTKMNPTGAKLCENGKTHSILAKQSYINCARKPEVDEDELEPCELIWNYTCVDEKISPHSCSLRECPFKGACVEVKHCDLKRLCYVEAVCTPEFLIPDKLRQSLRRNSE